MEKLFLGYILAILPILLFSGCATVKNEPPPPKLPELEEPSEKELSPQEEPVEVEEPESFVVSQEVFEETFEDVKVLIDKLNNIIRTKNFRQWKTYLTQEYIDTYSNPNRLNEISKQPILKRRNIKLTSLQDYFFHVVVPSRSRVKLDDLAFIDNTHVKAIMFIDEKLSILYLLEKKEGTWKIGIL